MDIHEYQAKEILHHHGIAVPRGAVATSGQEAWAAAQNLGGDSWVVKAQVHAGGRGKAGGIKVVQGRQQLEDATVQMLGSDIVTPQTGAQGKRVHKVYIEEVSNIDTELYLSVLVDRTVSRVAFIASLHGGMNIEEVAEKDPDSIVRLVIDPLVGVRPFHVWRMAKVLRLEGSAFKELFSLVFKLYEAFCVNDMSLLEINPLVVTQDNHLVCLDAKVGLDDSALYRHEDFKSLYDATQQDAVEVTAQSHGLNYVKLDGSIGCMVNGAGLAMATMDIIKLYGAAPANFLDVGGGAQKDIIKEAFRLMLSDKNVKAILVNIFGGIMRCDIVAEAIVAASRELTVGVPLVVRLEGTNAKAGAKIMKDSGLAIVPAVTLTQAAQKVVEQVGKER